MLTFITANLVWTEGFYIALFIAVVALAAWPFSRVVSYSALALFIFVFYFFRNPERVCPEFLRDPLVLICPADGKIVDIQHDPAGSFDGYVHKVAIFLSPLDVHVNWVPTPGTVERITYRPGTFSLAFLPKSSELNERNDLMIRHTSGSTLVVRQIAGTLARRICCFVAVHDVLYAGQKYGMIRFGSRVELLLPANIDLSVVLGQRVHGGQTAIGRWR